jgi:hypothetical protein
VPVEWVECVAAMVSEWNSGWSRIAPGQSEKDC